MKNLIILKGKKVIFSFIAVFLVTSAALAEDSIIKIGVLAKRGPERCIKKWSPTAEYLSNKIPAKTFAFVPVDFDQIYSVVEKSEVDFILVNSSFYVEMESLYGINRIATLKNKVLAGIYTKYGGAVFCKKQREDIRQYGDLKGKTFMAVEKSSFGGWRMAWRELKEAGIDPFKDFASMNFGGTHDAVVYAVRDGKVDAGTVRTDTLERMNAEGKISIDDFRVIHEHGGGKIHLPFLHSTREYPEWPIAKLKHTPNEVAEKVAVALIGMPQDSAAAHAARCAGWTIPLNYQSVHDCLKELKVGPYKNLGEITLTDVFRKYWILILIDLATLVVLSWFLATHIILNRKIKTGHRELELEVNQRIQTEELFRKERDKALGYLDIAGVIIVVLNNDQSVAVINKKGCEILGYDESEIIGKKWLDNFLPEKDRDQMRAVFSELMAGNIEPVKYYENYILTKDNKERLIAWNNSVLQDDEGKIVATLSSGEDITERKQVEAELRESEEKYRSMMNAMKDPVYICSSDYRVEYMNPAMIRSLGHDATGEKCFKAIHDLDEICTWCMHSKISRNECFEYDIVSPRNNRHYQITNSAIVHQDGSFSKMTVFRDTTDYIKIKEQLQQAQKMEAIGTLAGGIAHDFNNLLTTIIGNAQLALNDISKDDSLHKQIEEIVKAGQRSASLTRQLLAFSRKQVIKPEVLDLNNVINETEKMLKRMIGEDIEVQKVLEPELWKVHMDSGQVDQIIINLAVNARDAMPQGGKLIVETANVDLDKTYLREHGIEGTPGHYVMLAISDIGSGMDKETQEHIFEPFFTTKEIGKGTGLGLSTVYGIAKQNNGFIWVYSEPGHGTTFKIYLPKVKGDAEAEEKKRTPVGDLNGSETVLIVEDDDSLRKLTRKILERYGYSVQEAENGEDALRVSEAYDGSIHLMLTDVVMPKMSGRETAERLQPLYPKMKVIYMSGYTDNAIAHHGVLDPGLNFLEKPFAPGVLARKVREVLDK